MARKQKLINLHSFGTDTSTLLTGDSQLTLGEIAVQHVDGAAKLHIRVSSGNTVVEGKLASFIDETAVDQKITTAKNDVNQRITDLSDKIGGNFDTTNTVAKAIADEQKAREDGDKDLDDAISALTDTVKDEVAARKQTDAALSGVTDNLTDALGTLQGRVDTAEDNITAIQGKLSGITDTVKEYVDDAVSALTNDSLQEIEAAAKEQGDFAEITVTNKENRKQTVGISLTAITLADANEQNNGLAIAYDVKVKTTAIEGEVASAKTRLDTAESSIRTFNSQLSGFSTSDGAVKDYVDDAVSTAIASVYKVKGSVERYQYLPSSNLTEGDVYNVVSAETVDGKYYPAGTNWVWVAATTGETPVAAHWDPLGGTIDLSPYLTINAFETYTASTIGNALQGETITEAIGTIRSSISTLDTALSDETAARQSDVKEINDKIGGSYSSSSTVADAISTETSERTDADAAIEAKLGDGFTSGNTVTQQLAAEVSARTTLGNTVETQGQKITTLENGLTDEATTRKNADDAIEAKIGGSYSSSSTVADAISVEATTRKNADDAIEAKLGDGFSSANTVTKQLADEVSARETLGTTVQTHTQSISDLDTKLGSGVTTTNTVTAQLASIKSTADNAVQGVTVKNTATNGITANEDGTTHNVELDFDNMVIDCGTY